VDSIIAVHPSQIALHLLATLAPVATALGFALMVATRLQDELAEAANTDPLTGLANRRRVEALARPWIDDPDAPLCARSTSAAEWHGSDGLGESGAGAADTIPAPE
jgi:hypothetical protein